MASTQTRSVAGSSANAYPSTPNTISAAARPRLIFPLLEKKLDYIKTPVMDRIRKGEAVDNPKVEFTDERYRTFTASADAAGYASGVTTINVAAGHGQRFMLYDIWATPSGEYLLVTGISTDALTVATRGSIGGTAAAAIAANAALTYITQAVPEHVDSPQAILVRGEETYNYVQQFDFGITIPYLEDNSDNSYLVRGSSVYKYEMKKQAEEAKRSFERALIRGKRTIATTGGIPYTMGGLSAFTTANVTTMAGAILTELTFATAMQQVYDNVGPGNMATTMLSNMFPKRVFNSWVDPLRRATATDRKFSSVVTSWETEWGTIDFMTTPDMPIDELIAVNFPDLSRHPYKNLDWSEEPLAKNGMNNVGHVYGVQTALFPGDRARFKISGFSTTPGDYALLQSS